MKRLLALSTLFVAAALVLTVPDTARAQATNTSTLTVTANVVASCQVAASGPLAFGNYNGVVIENVSTDLVVTCNVATDHWVGLDRGETGNREMRDVATTSIPLGYELYRDLARTIVWDDTAAQGAGYTVNAVTSTSTVYGRLFANQIVATGGYDDNVLVTVNF